MFTPKVLLLGLVSLPLVALRAATAPPPDPDDMSSKSQILVSYPPPDIVTGGSCQTRMTTVVIRPTTNGLLGPVLVSGELEDKDSHRKLPLDAFQLLRRSANKDAGCETGYVPVTASDPIPESQLTAVQVSLKKEWVRPGNFAGILRIAAANDTAGQDLKLNVSVRPRYSWWLGILCIVIGSGISWFALVYTARQRQMAANQIVIARLAELLGDLRQRLQAVSQAGAPPPDATLQHITTILGRRLRQLLTDKELSVIAGVNVPATGTVSVLDEIEGVNHVVQNGFGQLLEFWNPAADADREKLKPLFGEMDRLGGDLKPLTEVDQGIKSILAKVPAAGIPTPKSLVGAAPTGPLPSESAVVHRIVFTTHLLDVISFLTVVILGVYILIWRNPGFGSVGNLIEAFMWGLGVKLGTDVARLGPSDVRNAIAIKIPSTG